MVEGSKTVVHIVLEIPSAAVLRKALQERASRDDFHNNLLACVVDRFLQQAKTTLSTELLAHLPESGLTEYTLEESGLLKAAEQTIQVSLCGYISEHFSPWFCAKLCKRAQQEAAEASTDFALETDLILPGVRCYETLQVKKKAIQLQIEFPRGATIRYRLTEA